MGNKKNLRKGTKRRVRKGSKLRKGTKLKQRKNVKQTKRIKLIIKNLGKTKKYKRVQYGCKNNAMKGGGLTFQPLTEVGYKLEDQLGGLTNTVMGYNSTSYNYAQP